MYIVSYEEKNETTDEVAIQRLLKNPLNNIEHVSARVNFFLESHAILK